MTQFRGRLRNKERGATAVLFAVLAVVILGLGAFAVDMGQVYAKRSALQSNVDLAVLAAAAELDNGGACNSEVVTVATEYLQKDANEVDGQYLVDLTGSPSDDDGFIQCNNWRVDLWAPRAAVDFGLAKALSDTNEGVDVPAHAAAQFKSPGLSLSMPMYAVSGCDYGTQTISDPPPGPPADPVVPDLDPDSATHVPTEFTILSPNPPEVDTGTSTPLPMTLKAKGGSNMTGTTAVGFTNPTAATPHYEVPASELSVTNTTVIINTTVPAGVLAQDGVWWVRIKKGTDWSEVQKAQPFTVGDLLFCDGSISGNFGTLRIARSETDHEIERNIIFGIEPLLELYGDLSATSCTDVNSDTVPVDGTNCLRTDPGFANEAATAGLVTGFSTYPGRLDKNTTPGCSRNNDSGRTAPTPTNPHNEALNDDQLKCFLLGGASIQDAVSGTPGVLSPDIYRSPRFFQLPVIPVEAEHGTSEHYPIIDFRPGFITNEPLTLRKADPTPSTIGDWNGLEFTASKVSKVNVVFFDATSLPGTVPAVGGESDYDGTGPKVLVLVE